MDSLQSTEMDTPITRSPRSLIRPSFYYGWVNMAMAAAAMVGTLPGRTQGLGLITEPLLRDLQISRLGYAQINLWATLAGSLFCLGSGRLLDRHGSRSVMAVIIALLGLVVLAMTRANGFWILLLMVALTRGLGQSALSVASLNLVGQWFGRRLNQAMAAYSVLVSVGFMLSFPVVGWLVTRHGWRDAWGAVGLSLLLALLPAVLLLVRRDPESCGLVGEERPAEESAGTGATFREALATPAFWIFAAASSAYNLIVSGIGLFNESILAERGFEAAVYHRALAVTAITSLAGNFLGGWLVARWAPNRVMALAMALLVAALLALPFLTAEWQVMVWAVFMGVVGGFIIVIFFSFWSSTYGRRHLGRIQGAAQMMTVLASATGPLMLAWCVEASGSYATAFFGMAGVVALLAVAAWRTRVPALAKQDASQVGS
ncbi:CynX/NimT family MFS transporter [Luteolibacter marinus]|uniref:MFS transporter n=1 Tax=Luteolibacter marinus TaxID=2776705 RepID=UPI00186748A6|nr:MFS transporter [Luteolibacter marinus]